jgi:nucleotide-binding universal stress UspA family protein
VDRAGELAKSLRVKVHIVSGYGDASDAHLIAPTAVGVPPAHAGEAGEKRTRAQHYADRARLRLQEAGVESETHVWPGGPAESLVQIADEQGAQMIVVGNRGMTGARRVLGSVPNHVSHHARCDVLIVATAEP